MQRSAPSLESPKSLCPVPPAAPRPERSGRPTPPTGSRPDRPGRRMAWLQAESPKKARATSPDLPLEEVTVVQHSGPTLAHRAAWSSDVDESSCASAVTPQPSRPALPLDQSPTHSQCGDELTTVMPLDSSVESPKPHNPKRKTFCAEFETQQDLDDSERLEEPQFDLETVHADPECGHPKTLEHRPPWLHLEHLEGCASTSLRDSEASTETTWTAGSLPDLIDSVASSKRGVWSRCKRLLGIKKKSKRVPLDFEEDGVSVQELSDDLSDTSLKTLVINDRVWETADLGCQLADLRSLSCKSKGWKTVLRHPRAQAVVSTICSAIQPGGSHSFLAIEVLCNMLSTKHGPEAFLAQAEGPDRMDLIVAALLEEIQTGALPRVQQLLKALTNITASPHSQARLVQYRCFGSLLTLALQLLAQTDQLVVSLASASLAHMMSSTGAMAYILLQAQEFPEDFTRRFTRLLKLVRSSSAEIVRPVLHAAAVWLATSEGRDLFFSFPVNSRFIQTLATHLTARDSEIRFAALTVYSYLVDDTRGSLAILASKRVSESMVSLSNLVTSKDPDTAALAVIILSRLLGIPEDQVYHVASGSKLAALVMLAESDTK